MELEWIISAGFLVAAAFNFLILYYNRGISFQSDNELGKIDPLFDRHGISTVLLFGLAYASLWNRFSEAPMVSVLFGVEKMYYAIHFVYWHRQNKALMKTLLRTKPLEASFLKGYGFGDCFFAMFFFAVGFYYRRNFFGPVTPE